MSSTLRAEATCRPTRACSPTAFGARDRGYFDAFVCRAPASAADVHYQTPSIVARFQNAQVISFGDYAVDQESLWHNEKRLPWSEVDHIDLKQSRLYVYRRGQTSPWDIIPVFRLPNMRILLEIVQAMAGIQQPMISRPTTK